MNAKLEDVVEYVGEHWQAMFLAGVFVLGLPIAIRTAIMQPKRQHARMVAYEQAKKEYASNHLVRMGEVVNGEVIDTVSETANLMPLYVNIDGRQIPVPLKIKTDYVAELNGIPASGKDGYDVKEGQILKY